MERADYLRVTNILYPFSGLSEVDPDVLEYAAQRGTKVHKICEGIMSGLGEIGLDDETWGYVESFKKWWGEGKEVVALEKRFWCDEFKITGQVDIIIKTPQGMAIVDLKTSSRVSKTWQPQGEAYYYLASKERYPITQIFFLHLNKHGKEPKLIEYDTNASFFFQCLSTYRYFFSKEKHE